MSASLKNMLRQKVLRMVGNVRWGNILHKNQDFFCFFLTTTCIMARNVVQEVLCRLGNFFYTIFNLNRLKNTVRNIDHTKKIRFWNTNFKKTTN